MHCKCSKAGGPQIMDSPRVARPINRTLKPVESTPLIGETPDSALDSWLTPNSVFYIRNHFDSPAISDLQDTDWTIHVEGAIENPADISFSDLSKFPKRTLAVTLECAGNNRTDLTPKVPGNQFESGAVSTAVWAGVSLSQVISSFEIDTDAVELLFEGADSGKPEPEENTQHFQRSLPMTVATHPDTILAFEMNGEPIGVAHGGPLRLIVPGWYGMASVKWLQKITVLNTPYEGYFQTHKYMFRSEENYERPVSVMRVKSLITSPSSGTNLKEFPHSIGGFAWSGNAEIDTVEVSTDGGSTWNPANFVGPSDKYSWRQWTFPWTNPNKGHYTLISRAKDKMGNLQPKESSWNELGYEVNGTKPICVNVL